MAVTTYPRRTGISVESIFGEVGDDQTDNTAGFSNFLASGGGTLPAGTYIVGAVTASAPFKLTWMPGAIVKQKANTASANWITLTAGAAGSDLGEAYFDGNKANQTFVSASTAIRLNTVDGVKMRGKIVNTLAYPILTTDCDRLDIEVTVEACNAVASFARGENCTLNVTAYGTDNSGLALYQHAIDYADMTNSTLSGIVRDLGGDASGLSNFASGITVLRATDCYFPVLDCSTPTADAIYTLGISFVGGKGNSGGSLISKGCRQNIEFAGMQDSVFATAYVDGEYNLTTAVPSADSIVGLIVHAGAPYAPSITSGSVSGTRNVHIGLAHIQRCGTGVKDRTGGVTFGRITSIGNTVDGYRLESYASAIDYFPGSLAVPLEKTVLGIVDFSGNGRAGLMLDEALRGLSISGGRIANNGQNTTNTAITRAGVAMQLTGLKQGVLIGAGVNVVDTQSYTKNLGASYEPGATDAANQYTFSLLSPGLLGLGENITLVNVLSGPADASGKIVAIDKDEFTVEFDSAKTFVDAVSSGTGTISSSGTTVTGVGTAFTTEIIGRCWIKADGEYRQVMTVTSDTSLTVNAAFTAPLAGDTFERVRASITGIPSQQYGVYYDQYCTDCDFGQANYGSSNVIAAMHGGTVLSSIPNTFRPGAEATLYASGTYAASTNTNIYGSVPVGYEIVGYRWMNTSDVTGVTGPTITLRLAGGATVTLATGLGIVKNTKSEGNIVPVVLTANTQLNALFSGGGDNVPDGGTYKCELRVRRASFAAFASVA
jgi:hypothetical protein